MPVSHSEQPIYIPILILESSDRLDYFCGHEQPLHISPIAGSEIRHETKDVRFSRDRRFISFARITGWVQQSTRATSKKSLFCLNKVHKNVTKTEGTTVALFNFFNVTCCVKK